MAAKVLRRVFVPGCSVMVAIPVISNKVYAESNCSNCETSNRIKPSQLPIYGNPACRVGFEVEEEKIGGYGRGITEVRKAVWTYMDSIKDTTDKVYSKYEIGKAHTQDLLYYIQNDPGFLPRAAVITVFGLSGIVAGYKGGVLRKAVFSGAAMTAGAALCYPNQAVDISKTCWQTAKGQAVDLWKGSSGTQKEEVTEIAAPVAEKVEAKEAVVEEKAAVAKDTVTRVAPSGGEPPKAPKEDLGQSNKEDKDLYSTRS